MRLATAACMQKYGNVSFVTVACAKCMRYGGGGVGDHTIGGGGGLGSGILCTSNHVKNVRIYDMDFVSIRYIYERIYVGVQIFSFRNLQCRMLRESRRALSISSRPRI